MNSPPLGYIPYELFRGPELLLTLLIVIAIILRRIWRWSNPRPR